MVSARPQGGEQILTDPSGPAVSSGGVYEHQVERSKRCEGTWVSGDLVAGAGLDKTRWDPRGRGARKQSSSE